MYLHCCDAVYIDRLPCKHGQSIILIHNFQFPNCIVSYGLKFLCVLVNVQMQGSSTIVTMAVILVHHNQVVG